MSVRIIAGQWRRRRIPITPHEQLRPSGDRVRETLFNWLTPYLDGACCLDLFAGTGVLGIEALSRGALKATLVEKDVQLAAQLNALSEQFDHPGLTIIHREALDWLRTTEPEPYDIVFLDPPFKENLLHASLELLQAGWLAPHAKIYIESGEELSEFVLPESLEWTKRARLGNVSLGLAATRA